MVLYRPIRARTLAALIALSTALTCASAVYQRVGARRMVEGEGFCGAPAPCAIPALGAGFPLPFLVDNPQVSVPHAIGLFEDDFRPGAFVVDALFWFGIGIIIRQIFRSFRRRQVAAR